jgi:SNF2 family DNA or RNA helicase
MDHFESANLYVGSFVRRRKNTRDTGVIVEIVQASQRPRARVQFATGTRTIPVDQLELVPSATETAAELLRKESFSNVRELRRHLAHVRLSGRMSDMLYSLEATDTDFYAHQFKPVLKMLDSPTGHLLIADEVGLGKTIEAGLIWTELAARMRYRRLLVVCPKVLCEKWRFELVNKFDLDARIMSPADLQDALTSTTLQKRGFVAICGMQSIRPRRESDRSNRPVDILANTIDELDPFDDRLDLVVIDEAHHMRNPGTQSQELGKMLAKIAHHVVMLSATPINLGNRDLHSLLRLLDEDTFREQETLEAIVDANAPVIRARDTVLSGKPVDEIISHLNEAFRHELLSGTKTLSSILKEVKKRSEIDASVRADLAHRLDGLNQLANVINRTRRRDVQEHRVIREVQGQILEMTATERDVYQNVTSVIRNFAAQSGRPVGFLTVMPQRMLASSMPAALAHWRAKYDVTRCYEDELLYVTEN